ncbi:MAG: hypothetical protein M1833_007079 [Piccolia ochrophora]|nr:MAG: hypothetical protein M1833_007079 [Piccolia ochrophora]
MPNPSKPCHFFQQGRCTKGRWCKFRHGEGNKDVNVTIPFRSQPGTRSVDEQASIDDYLSWKRILKSPSNGNVTIAHDLWTGALHILDGADRDQKQRLPEDLTSDKMKGLDHVSFMLTTDFDGAHGLDFTEHVKPFLFVISHVSLLDCLIVDAYVGDLYTFISGSHGERAIRFFDRVCTRLVEEVPALNTRPRSQLHVSSRSQFDGPFLAMLTALRETLRRNHRALHGEGLSALLDSCSQLCEISGLTDASPKFFNINNILQEITAIVHRGNDLLVDDRRLRQTALARARNVQSTFPRNTDLPGNRHDNDNLDIAKIQVVPTVGEIRCDRPEYLPFKDTKQPHFLEGAERHFDTHFRLLRHDVLGDVKAAIGGFLCALDANPDLWRDLRLQSPNNIRYHVYHQARIERIAFKRNAGVEANISFRQPPQARKLSMADRRIWWEERKRMEDGSLLCYIFSSQGEASALLFNVSKGGREPQNQNSLHSNEFYAQATARLAREDDQSELEKLIGIKTQESDHKNILVEFPGILMATFVPILENLQSMQKRGRLPFQRWIAPTPIDSGQYDTILTQSSTIDHIPPPCYARRDDFVFDLKEIVKVDGDRYNLSPATSVNNDEVLRQLEARTVLDSGQCQALLTALTQEFALIQGPPGTGKSFIGIQLMRVLIDNRMKADLGPVVIVCYTNHALDQFLECLIEVGMKKIIRVGGQCKSELVEGKNLRGVAQAEPRTRMEKHAEWQSFRDTGHDEELITNCLKSISGLWKRSWASLKRYLLRHHRRIWYQFDGSDEKGYKEQSQKDPIQSWSSKTDRSSTANSQQLKPLDILQEQAENDVYSLSTCERAVLLDQWVKGATDECLNLLHERLETFRQHKRERAMIFEEIDRRCLEEAEVIGITTTGLAKKIETLRHVKAKVVICEEAGEVLESHLLSALLPSVEHLIQIGDHQQLRPQINNFSELSLESRLGGLYRLDESLFERLCNAKDGDPQLPIAQLNVQRRMRPPISSLIRETLYPNLKDHDFVSSYPNVVGLRKNLFWLDHKNLEAGSNTDDPHQKSHSNPWEVKMTHALVRHLIRQGTYNSKEIAVITPYVGQLQNLRAELRNSFEVVLSERDEEALALEEIEFGQVSSTSTSRIVARKKVLGDLLRVATV